jgi:hypothetical protein
VVAVAVGEQDRVGLELVGARGRLRVAGQERVDEHVVPPP